jgi:hypothetical protein
MTIFGKSRLKTMGWIQAERLRNLMKDRNVEVAGVDVPSIFKSTQYKIKLS